MCVQGMPENHGLVHWGWFSMLKRRIADVSPPHVHGDCSYQGAYGRHLPLWSRPTNMRQPSWQTKFMRIKPMMLHVNSGFCMEQYFMSMQKPVHMAKSVYAWVATPHRRVQTHLGKWEEMAKIHMATTLASALCNPWTPTHLQPYAQNLNPRYKEWHPHATKWSWSVDRVTSKPSRIQNDSGQRPPLLLTMVDLDMIPSSDAKAFSLNPSPGSALKVKTIIYTCECVLMAYPLRKLAFK